MTVNLKASESRIRVVDSPEALRSGGETRPYDYPHLYQIQAGDWRISYAVEQNHLAILVLEVLNPDGSVRKDPASETLTRKMKVRLLDWPEGSPSRDLPPEELGKKVKIKLLDLADELRSEESRGRQKQGRIRLAGSSSKPSAARRVTILDATAKEPSPAAESEASAESEATPGRKITPLNSPSL